MKKSFGYANYDEKKLLSRDNLFRHCFGFQNFHSHCDFEIGRKKAKLNLGR